MFISSVAHSIHRLRTNVTFNIHRLQTLRLEVKGWALFGEQATYGLVEEKMQI